MKIHVRKMQKSDLDAIMAIEERSYGKGHWSKDSFYHELSNKIAHYYSAVNELGEVIGYAGFWMVLDEAHITTISIHSSHRRKHIGEAILRKIIEDCWKNEVKYITLEVRVSNIAAIKLYEKYGFKSLSTRKAYYQDNKEDALIMWTENIFYDSFKALYNDNAQTMKDVEVVYE